MKSISLQTAQDICENMRKELSDLEVLCFAIKVLTNPDGKALSNSFEEELQKLSNVDITDKDTQDIIAVITKDFKAKAVLVDDINSCLDKVLMNIRVFKSWDVIDYIDEHTQNK